MVCGGMRCASVVYVAQFTIYEVTSRNRILAQIDDFELLPNLAFFIHSLSLNGFELLLPRHCR